MKRWVIAIGLTLCGVAAVAILLFDFIRQPDPAFVAVETHLAERRAELAESVIALSASHPVGSMIMAKALPPALQAPGVAMAIIGVRHVTLVVSSNPDGYRGFRIWDGPQSAEYSDSPTPTPGVFRFVYCDDYPESSTNRPQ
jgi:hypothetical protein